MIPKLRFPEFTGAWRIKHLGDISEKGQYGMNSASKSYDGTNKYLRITDIDENSHKFNHDSLTSPSGQLEDRYLLEHGDLLFTRTGASTGKTYLYNDADGRVFFAGFLIRFHVNGADPYFVFSQTLRRNYQKWVGTMSARSGQPGINADEYAKFSISLPTKPEQEKIADFLTAVDERIAASERKCELLVRYKRGVMQQLFSQKLRFRKLDGNDYPDWQKKKLCDVLSERSEQKPERKEYPLMAFVAYKGVSPKGDRYNREFLVSKREAKKYKQTEYGDFIYSSNNLETGSIGLNNYGPASISPVYSIFSVKNGNNAQFIGSYLLRKRFIYEMVRFRQGVVYGQWRIHESDFLKIKQPIPSPEEQQKIADFLTALDNRITTERTKLTAAKQFKKALLQRMFV